MATADGLDTWTRVDVERGTGQVEKLVEEFLARKYHAKQGPDTRLDLLKCIDLYHSKELAALTKRLVLQPHRTYIQQQSKP